MAHGKRPSTHNQKNSDGAGMVSAEVHADKVYADMKPRVYFLELAPPPTDLPLHGGPKVTLQHINILNDNGIPAFYVYNANPGESISEDYAHPEPLVPAVSLGEAMKTFRPDVDFWVFNALGAPHMQKFPGNNKIIFIQCAYYAHINFPAGTPPTVYPWQNLTLKGILTVSEHNKQLIELAAPTAKVYHVQNSVDTSIFIYRDYGAKDDLVVSAADTLEKNSLHLRTLLNTLIARTRSGHRELQNTEIRILNSMEPAHVADHLARAKILFFLSTNEGLGLLPLEAMLSGCIVMAYDVPPLNSYLPDEYRFEWGDIGSIVKTVESICAGKNAEKWRSIMKGARERALEFSVSAQTESVLAAYSEILSG